MCLRDADDLIQFEFDCFRVPVLGVLDEEDDQKRDNGGAGVDDKVLGSGKPECRPSRRPDGNVHQRHPERGGVSRVAGYDAGKAQEEARASRAIGCRHAHLLKAFSPFTVPSTNAVVALPRRLCLRG